MKRSYFSRTLIGLLVFAVVGAVASWLAKPKMRDFEEDPWEDVWGDVFEEDEDPSISG